MDERWGALFADLDAQLAGAQAAELDAEVRERVRAETARQTLAERATAALGTTVTVTVRGAGTVTGTLADATPAWWLLEDGTLVAAHAIDRVTGLPAAAEALSKTAQRLTLGYALRRITRARVTLTDGTTLRGTFTRVGADHADLATDGGVTTLAFAALATVTSA